MMPCLVFPNFIVAKGSALPVESEIFPVIFCPVLLNVAPNKMMAIDSRCFIN